MAFKFKKYLDNFLKHYLNVTDYFTKAEFAERSALHYHGLLFCKGAPDFNELKKTLSSFNFKNISIDKFEKYPEIEDKINKIINYVDK